MIAAGALHPLVLDPRAFPMVRPQLACVGDAVYFGRYAVAQVTPLELRFLDACTGRLTLADAVAAAGVDGRCAARVSPWLLWLDRPAPASFLPPSMRRERIVLSASHAHAWLGMGGRLLADSDRVPTAVITCFGSVGTSRVGRAFPTAAAATLACRDEARLVGRLAQVSEATWDFPDADLRATLDSGDGDVADALRTLIAGALARHQPAQVFAPAALDASADSRMLFDAVLTLYVEGTLAADLHFYEDAPAVHGYRQIDEFLGRFEGGYLDAREYYVDVTATCSRKAALLDAFKCSVDAPTPGLWLESAGRNARILRMADVRHAERYWALTVRAIE